MILTDNVTKLFSHTWKILTDSKRVTQIDSGRGWTWATGPTDSLNKAIYSLENGNWVQADGHLTHATVGKSGVWGVNNVNVTFFREGVAASTLNGTKWTALDGRMTQIDAGSSGVVYAVNRCSFAFATFSLTKNNL